MPDTASESMLPETYMQRERTKTSVISLRRIRSSTWEPTTTFTWSSTTPTEFTSGPNVLQGTETIKDAEWQRIPPATATSPEVLQTPVHSDRSVFPIAATPMDTL